MSLRIGPLHSEVGGIYATALQYSKTDTMDYSPVQEKFSATG